MKKIFVLALALAMGMMMVSFALAADGTQNDSNTTFTTTAGTGINGTVHDLSTNHNGINYIAAPADALQRICIFCHAPHNTIRLSTAPGGSGPAANAAFNYLPLWNHELTANFGSYTMYENGTGAPQIGPKASQAILNGMTQPGGVSLLCLSCHDGTVAVNSYGNTDQPSYSQSGGGSTIAGNYVIGKDNYLGNHHPIGFDYDAVVADDTQIRSADVATFTSATDLVRNHLFTGTDGPSMYMECATCHAVHNTGNTGESLLWRSDTQSQFCLTCHIKGTDPTGTYDAQAAGFIQ
jgi:predicted CXXCH cytochrome family protein